MRKKIIFVLTADVVPAAATRCHKRAVFYSVHILKQKFDFLFTILAFFFVRISTLIFIFFIYLQSKLSLIPYRQNNTLKYKNVRNL